MPNINLVLTNKCSLSCIHCYTQSGQIHIQDLSPRHWEVIANFINEMDTKKIILFGGEPLIYPYFRDFVTFLCSSTSVKLGLLTNGIHFDKDVIDFIKRNHFFTVGVSLYALWEKFDHFVRRKGAFQKLLNGIDLASHNDLFLDITVVLNKNNLHLIEEIPQITKNRKIRSIRFFYMTPLGRGKNLLKDMVSPAEWNNLHQRLSELRNNSGISVSYEDVFGNFNLAECKIISFLDCPHTLWPQIDTDGTLYLCPISLRIPDHAVVNIFERVNEDSIAYCITKYIKKISDTIHNCGLVTKCKSCVGGCPIMMANNHGNRDIRCKNFGFNYDYGCLDNFISVGDER